MKKLFILLTTLALSACTYKNDISGKNMPKFAETCKVYNGSGLILDMQKCNFKLQTVRNEVIIGRGENWLIYTIEGIDVKDGRTHTYSFLDSEALTILWE